MEGRISGWLRRYPPLVPVVMALLLAVFLLPSALNLPQANPGQTLEYAPVPGTNGSAPPGGNLGALGLGSGGEPAGGGGNPPPALGPPPPAQSIPSAYQCIGNPPKQTEDPLSPPCVAAYQGDNGGSTYTGVTGNEIRILVYISGGGDAVNGQVPTNTYCDLMQAGPCTQSSYETYYRYWEKYFNERYQTYKRLVHFWLYFSAGNANDLTASGLRADGADNIAHVHPFAVIGVRPETDLQPYFDAMAQAGVLNFGGLAVQRSLSAYQRYHKLEWGFQPPVEYVADRMADWVCRKVKPNPVSFSGNPTENSKPRVYGFLYTTDPNQPNYKAMQAEALNKLEGCGISFKDKLAYPIANIEPVDSGDQQTAANNMAQFKKDGVTTILWAGGYAPSEVNAAQNTGYFPEWITSDDFSGFDSDVIGSIMPPQEWAHAWVISPVTFWNAHGYPVEPQCFDAYTSVDPNVDRTSFDLPLACEGYDALRMMFTAIQVAGPRLTPDSIDQGFHAIPPHPSGTPQEPACFYNSGDYTCVKDAVAMWWDPTAPPTGRNPSSVGGSSNGCWRMAENGNRYLPGQWPSGDPAPEELKSDVCNLYQGWF